MVRPDYTAPNCLKATVKKVIDISPFGLRNGKQKKSVGASFVSVERFCVSGMRDFYP